MASRRVPAPDPNGPVMCGLEVMSPEEIYVRLPSHAEFTYAQQEQYQRGLFFGVQEQYQLQVQFDVIGAGFMGSVGVVLLIWGLFVKTQRPLTPAEMRIPGNVWRVRTGNSSLTLNSVAWTGTDFVAVGELGTILTSPGGDTWTKHPSGTSQHLLGVACSDSHQVAAGADGTLLTSAHGGS